ncbi:MAG TPA: SDR family oxidoreductase [Vicinamibacterales bacterium]|jgi:3-oxoacyl-[acyl-carrier protein] reductase|nr:SDR family oxidoreductase [Vicinamibacterales bacterium]
MVAIVTGGSKGIGFAIARAFIKQGMNVVISARKDGELARAVDELGGAERIAAVRADVRRAADADRLVNETVQRFGGVDVLVNNAGIGRFANVADMPIETWQEVIDTNLSGVFYCCHAAVPELRRRNGGYIVNIASLAGKNPFVQGAAYCASKAGLIAFSEALMQEVRHDNIRVSYVMPGSVSTDFIGRNADDSWKLTADDVAQVVLDLVTLDNRALASRVELRPSRPPRKS